MIFDALPAILAARTDSAQRFGHTREANRMLPVAKIPATAQQYLVDALLCLEAPRNPQQLERAELYLTKGTATMLAAIDRIRDERAALEQEEAA